MMISTKLQALRNLFTQHARVALLSEQGEICVEQNHLARMYAKQYSQNYDHILWLDASNQPLLRLSCQQQCHKLGLQDVDDPLRHLQQWMNQHAHLLLVVEHARDPQLLADLQDQAHHLLFCSALPSWPTAAPDTALLRLPQAGRQLLRRGNAQYAPLVPALGGNWLAWQLAKAWFSYRQSLPANSARQRGHEIGDYLLALQNIMPGQSLGMGQELRPMLESNEVNLALEPPAAPDAIPAPLRAAFLLNQAELSSGARHLLGIFAWFGPQALPYLLLLQAHQGAERASWQMCAQELIALQFCQAANLSNPDGEDWPTLEFSPTVQYLQRAMGDANDALCAQQLLQDLLSMPSLPKALLPHLACHLEYLLAHQQQAPEQAALLLQQLEQHYQHQPRESEVLLRRILDLKHASKPNHSATDADTLAYQNLLAQNLKNQGRLDEAQQLLFSALQLARQHLGENAPETCIYLNNLARLFATRGQHLAAVELEQQALAILRRVLGEAHPHVLAVMHNLSHSLLHLPADEKVEALLEELVQIHLRIFGECDWRSQAAMDQLAGNLFAQHKLAEAAGWSERVLLVRKQLFGVQHAETTIAAYDLMCLYFELEQAGQAYQIFNEYLVWLQHANALRLSEQQKQICHLLREFLPAGKTEASTVSLYTLPASHLLH